MLRRFTALLLFALVLSGVSPGLRPASAGELRVEDNLHALTNADQAAIQQEVSQAQFNVTVVFDRAISRDQLDDRLLALAKRRAKTFVIGVDPDHGYVATEYSAGTGVSEADFGRVARAGMKAFGKQEWAAGVLRMVQRAETLSGAAPAHKAPKALAVAREPDAPYPTSGLDPADLREPPAAPPAAPPVPAAPSPAAPLKPTASAPTATTQVPAVPAVVTHEHHHMTAGWLLFWLTVVGGVAWLIFKPREYQFVGIKSDYVPTPVPPTDPLRQSLTRSHPARPAVVVTPAPTPQVVVVERPAPAPAVGGATAVEAGLVGVGAGVLVGEALARSAVPAGPQPRVLQEGEYQPPIAPRQPLARDGGGRYAGGAAATFPTRAATAVDDDDEEDDVTVAGGAAATFPARVGGARADFAPATRVRDDADDDADDDDAGVAVGGAAANFGDDDQDGGDDDDDDNA